MFDRARGNLFNEEAIVNLWTNVRCNKIVDTRESQFGVVGGISFLLNGQRVNWNRSRETWNLELWEYISNGQIKQRPATVQDIRDGIVAPPSMPSGFMTQDPKDVVGTISHKIEFDLNNQIATYRIEVKGTKGNIKGFVKEGKRLMQDGDRDIPKGVIP